jgi:hypothetical protein
MSTTPTIPDAKAQNQGFLLLGLSSLCLLVLVPGVLIVAHFTTNADASRILQLCGFVPVILGVGLAFLGNRILSGKTKTF